jgi:hypothetical protein
MSAREQVTLFILTIYVLYGIYCFSGIYCLKGIYCFKGIYGYEGLSMKTTVYLDKESSDAMKELPRKVSASAILRHILKATVTTDEEWDKYITTNEEGKTVRAFIRTNLKKRL